jgi:hypothetical protein
MRAFGMQLSCAVVLAAMSSGGVLAMPGAPAHDAGHAAKPSLHAAYQDDSLIARSTERMLGRGEFASMPELVDSLLRLMPTLTRYHQPDSQPPVFRVTRAQIEAQMCGGQPCAMRAWYLPGEGIYLEDTLHPESDLFDRSVLFHELVHYLQELNAEGEALDACNRWYQREVQAYGLQNRYLGLTGSSARVSHPGYPCRDARQATTGAAPLGARGVSEDGSQALAR